RRSARTAIGLSAIILTSRATVGSTGISSRRAIGWRRGVGWRRAVAWGRSAILCICLHDPGGRSQNAYSCDGDKARLIVTSLCFDKSATEVMHARTAARILTLNLLYIAAKGFRWFRVQTRTPPECGSFQREVRAGSREFLTSGLGGLPSS